MKNDQFSFDATGQKTSEQKTSAAASAPLFFQDAHPITLERHRTAGLRQQGALEFAKKTNSIPINTIEFMECARSYPIVFTPGEFCTPVVLVGLREDNLFISGNEGWKPQSYIPAYVRKFPFALMEWAEKEAWLLCVDEANPLFMKENADMRFYEGEEPTEMARTALEFCKAFQQHHHITQQFITELKAQNMLEERSSAIDLPDGSKCTLRGFLMLDEKKFAALPADILANWHQKGWTLLASAVILSQNNWKYLAQLTPVQAAKAA